jgi:hypothetical protein
MAFLFWRLMLLIATMSACLQAQGETYHPMRTHELRVVSFTIIGGLWNSGDKCFDGEGNNNRTTVASLGSTSTLLICFHLSYSIDALSVSNSSTQHPFTAVLLMIFPLMH